MGVYDVCMSIGIFSVTCKRFAGRTKRSLGIRFFLLSFSITIPPSPFNPAHGSPMPRKILIADDDDDVRNSHKLAIAEVELLLHDKCEVVETADSVDTQARIRSERFDLILLDNEFKDSSIKGHLPGIGILQVLRRGGINKDTPVIFCTAETFNTLKPMVERFGAVHFPKATYDIDEVARLFAGEMTKPRV
jgi:CheY-like chemotaxis protein